VGGSIQNLSKKNKERYDTLVGKKNCTVTTDRKRKKSTGCHHARKYKQSIGRLMGETLKNVAQHDF